MAFGQGFWSVVEDSEVNHPKTLVAVGPANFSFVFITFFCFSLVFVVFCVCLFTVFVCVRLCFLTFFLMFFGFTFFLKRFFVVLVFWYVWLFCACLAFLDV